MLRPFRRLWAVCLLLASPAFAVGQDTVTTLPRPADDGPTITPLLTSQNIPPAAVLTQGPVGPPPAQSPVEQGLHHEFAIGARFSTSPTEVGLLFPAIHQNLNGLVNVGNLYTASVQLPSAPLHFT